MLILSPPSVTFLPICSCVYFLLFFTEVSTGDTAYKLANLRFPIFKLRKGILIFQRVSGYINASRQPGVSTGEVHGQKNSNRVVVQEEGLCAGCVDPISFPV